MNSPHPTLAREAFAWLWLALFLGFGIGYATVLPPPVYALPLMALSGLAWHVAFERDRLRELVARFRVLFTAAAFLAIAIAVSETLARGRGIPGLAPAWPPQVWLLACLPSLALFLDDDRRLAAVMALLAALCAYHFVAMPIEAVTGHKLGWHPAAPLPRDAGPLHFQASGLAWQAYYFPGLMLPIFYLATGPLASGGLDARWRLTPAQWIALAFLWLLPAACVQSRAAFAGALAAALFALASHRPPRRPGAWLALMVLVGLGGFFYWYLFSTNKSGLDLRLAYYKLYLQESFRWPEAIVGHGASSVPNYAMWPNGYQPLEHSHNDLVQVVYAWGALALAAYVALWVALVRTVYRLYVERRQAWPVCAALAFLPNTFTDLGLHHYEKAVFIVLFAAFCVAFARRAARLPA